MIVKQGSLVTTSNVTGLLRWRLGVTTYDCGVIFKQYLEWRDVPQAEDSEP